MEFADFLGWYAQISVALPLLMVPLSYVGARATYHRRLRKEPTHWQRLCKDAAEGIREDATFEEAFVSGACASTTKYGGYLLLTNIRTTEGLLALIQKNTPLQQGRTLVGGLAQNYVRERLGVDFVPRIVDLSLSRGNISLFMGDHVSYGSQLESLTGEQRLRVAKATIEALFEIDRREKDGLGFASYVERVGSAFLAAETVGGSIGRRIGEVYGTLDQNMQRILTTQAQRRSERRVSALQSLTHWPGLQRRAERERLESNTCALGSVSRTTVDRFTPEFKALYAEQVGCHLVPTLCHGDIHPDNVLIPRDLGRFEDVVLIDFDKAYVGDPLTEMFLVTQMFGLDTGSQEMAQRFAQTLYSNDGTALCAQRLAAAKTDALLQYTLRIADFLKWKSSDELVACGRYYVTKTLGSIEDPVFRLQVARALVDTDSDLRPFSDEEMTTVTQCYNPEMNTISYVKKLIPTPDEGLARKACRDLEKSLLLPEQRAVFQDVFFRLMGYQTAGTMAIGSSLAYAKEDSWNAFMLGTGAFIAIGLGYFIGGGSRKLFKRLEHY